MAWLKETLFNILDLTFNCVILDLKGQAMPAVSSTLTTGHPLRWPFLRHEEMKTEQENAEAMLDFWGELYDMAMRRGDQEALRNIPTDIYMLLGMRVKSGFADEFEESGCILSDGCERAFDPIALDG